MWPCTTAGRGRRHEPRAWLNLGIVFGNLADPASALGAFRTARRLGERAAAAFYIGSALVQLGHAHRAIRYLEEAVRFNTRDGSSAFDRADALEELGIAHEALGARRHASAAYQRALALRPDGPRALNNLAALLIDRGAVRRAEKILDRLVTEYPGLEATWITTGNFRLRCGDLTRADRAFQRALEINPQSVQARINLGATYTLSGRARKAAHPTLQRGIHATATPSRGLA